MHFLRPVSPDTISLLYDPDTNYLLLPKKKSQIALVILMNSSLAVHVVLCSLMLV